ncbi:DEAD/DEAH box helicase [Aquiluna borgnonia]|uniref:DEAD/DEAH box helicase n=1 Tax=Aquiluna borgnonia TaxID=2499157 RepID=A0A7D4Q4P8_9MICO|nr:DEAD/DEAH box helicase [Aquiluna borgnonia]QKJ25729.1 DEAD/DEAH box helicase [Aquiluna borgnonia]
MPKDFSAPSRASRPAAAGKKRAVAPKWESSRSEAPAKRDGRKGYASNKGDYVPKAERSFDPERKPRAAKDFDPERKPRASREFEADRKPRTTRDFDPSRKSYSSERPDRVARDNDRNRSFEGARAKSSTGKTFSQDVKLEKLESATEAASFATFQEMDLPERLTQELAKMGAAAPFPIQAATIPVAMAGRDVLGRGKTGSGKTIAFGVPLIAMLAAQGNQPRKPLKPKALVLAPTRELADQIDRTLSQLAKSVGFYTTTIYGGVPQFRQEQALKRGVDIAIATPGRLEDLMAQGLVDLSECERIVLDEADHMCELGFVEPVTRILEATGDSQKLLFSATLDKQVASLVKRFMPNPYVYEVPGEVNESSDIDHIVLTMEPKDRSQVFHRLVQGEGKSIVFVRTKATAEALSQSLNDAGVSTARLHGDLNQAQRTRNLERFTHGAARVMIATDLAARGIHVDDVKLVIQLDLPEEYKTYLHRAGRTGRAGRSGTVVSLVPLGRTRKVEGLLERADREAKYVHVTAGDKFVADLAGPIAPPPVVDSLDFGDSRFESTNKSAVKKNLRERHSGNKLYAAKDRRFRQR